MWQHNSSIITVKGHMSWHTASGWDVQFQPISTITLVFESMPRVVFSGCLIRLNSIRVITLFRLHLRPSVEADPKRTSRPADGLNDKFALNLCVTVFTDHFTMKMSLRVILQARLFKSKVSHSVQSLILKDKHIGSSFMFFLCSQRL